MLAQRWFLVLLFYSIALSASIPGNPPGFDEKKFVRELKDLRTEVSQLKLEVSSLKQNKKKLEVPLGGNLVIHGDFKGTIINHAECVIHGNVYGTVVSNGDAVAPEMIHNSPIDGGASPHMLSPLCGVGIGFVAGFSVASVGFILYNTKQ